MKNLFVPWSGLDRGKSVTAIKDSLKRSESIHFYSLKIIRGQKLF